MKIAIQSFFIDYYDHWFDSRHEADEIWHRRGDLPPYKDAAFEALMYAGYSVPLNGTIKELRKNMSGEQEVVVYTDTTAHCAQGKYKSKLKDVEDETLFASYFNKRGYENGRPTSVRELWAGDRCFHYKLSSDHEWMSNTGDDFEISEVSEMKNMKRRFHYPLYAIDFVAGSAVDLNRCPGLKGTGIEGLITAKECAESIMNYMQFYDADGNFREGTRYVRVRDTFDKLHPSMKTSLEYLKER